MSCQHCVRAVEQALQAVAGVTVKRVGIGVAEVEYDPAQVDAQALVDAVEEAGYTVEEGRGGVSN
ncbi:MAG: hypothetical protein KatS3mg044_1202 [Rhodothermaceae bacterium]|nr:MAG: hypothetical protein KatS3mg044_1202 [Rhodothermaceae bacterium]